MTPEERIEAARARKAAADAKASDLAAAAASERAATTAEREADDAEAVANAMAELGEEGRDFKVVPTDLGCVILKRPEQASYRRFTDTGKSSNVELEKLVMPCVWYPPKPSGRFDRILERLPATLHACADAVCLLAGVRAQEVSGK